MKIFLYILLASAYAVISLVIFVRVIMIKTQEKWRRLALPRRNDMYRQWREDAEKLNDWHQRHRLGALNDKDRKELEGLQLCEIGSYMIYCNSENRSFWDRYGNQQLDKLGKLK